MERINKKYFLKIILILVLFSSEQCVPANKQVLRFTVSLTKGLCNVNLSENNIEFGDIPIDDIEKNNVEAKNLNILVSDCTADLNGDDAAPKITISGNTIYHSNSIFNNKYDSAVGFVFKNKGSSSLIENNDDVWHYDKNNNSFSIDLDLSLKCLDNNCLSVKEGRIYSNVKFSFFYF